MRAYAQKPNCWLSKYIWFLCYFMPLLIISLNTTIICWKLFKETDTLRVKMQTQKEEINEDPFPLCTGHLLEQENIFYKKGDGESYSSNIPISKSPDGHICKLLLYTLENAVACFDNFYRKNVGRNNSEVTDTRGIGNLLHFVFIGDSRIRQHFFCFLKLVPDYDRITQPLEIPGNVISFIHGDIDVDSTILGLRVSFKWRPIINITLIETIRQWGQSDTSRPDLLFLSMEVHHMLRSHGADFKLYQKGISEIAPSLNELAKLKNVIWLNQYPTLDLYGSTHADNTYIYTEKIHHYNEAVHKILKKYSYVRIWDSSNAFAEEYIRGCRVYSRVIPSRVFVDEGASPFINCKSYVNCEDFIHTGYVALAEASQLLYNDICNAFLSKTEDYN